MLKFCAIIIEHKGISWYHRFNTDLYPEHELLNVAIDMKGPARKKILLVEDETVTAISEAKIISGFGYDVINACDGEEAVKIALGADPPDLVLMDIDLGAGIDGTEAARRILEKKNIPVVFLTLHGEREMVDRVRGITRYGYVIKNSGSFVLQSSIEMAFDLFEAHERSSKSDMMMRTLVRSIPDLVWLKNPEGVYLACNHEFERFFGAPQEEIVGKNDYDFLDDDLAEFFRGHDRRAMEAGKPTMNEEWITFRDDGTRALLETIKTPMIGKDGRLIGILGIGRDITQRKKMEEAYRENQRMLMTLISNLPGMVYRCSNDPDWSMEFISEGCSAVTGYSSAELTGSKVIGYGELIHPDDRELVWNGIQDALRDRQSYQLEYRIVAADGSVKTLWEQGRGVFSESGGLIALEGFITDITEHKHIEIALKTSESFLNSVIDLSPLPMWISDDRGTLIRQNQACRDLFRISDDEVVGKYNAFQDEAIEMQGFMPFVKGVFEKGRMAKFTYAYDRNRLRGLPPDDQSLVTVQATLSPVVDYAGKVANVIIQHVDITELKATEQRLIKSNREKEFILKEMQHRMKNTLSVVSGLLALEENKIGDKDARLIFQEAISRIQSIGRVYRQLYQTDSLDTIDLKQYIDETARQLLAIYALNPGMVELSLSLDEAQCSVKRAMNIGLILNEVLLNALKHAFPPDTRGKICITMKRNDSGITLFVSDDGRGMNPDYRAGAGMGLQIVESLAGEIRGEFSIESGNGTTARLVIRDLESDAGDSCGKNMESG